MTGSTLRRFLEAAAQAIRDDVRVPEAAEVSVWRGRVGAEVLDRLSTRDPAIVLACDRADLSPDLSPVSMNLTIVALCMSRGGKDRDDVALTLVEGLTRWIDDWVWGPDFNARPPDRITARNLWTPSVDKKGVTIWALAWTQQLELPPLAPGEPWIPETLWIDDEVAGPQDLTPEGEEFDLDWPGAGGLVWPHAGALDWPGVPVVQ